LQKEAIGPDDPDERSESSEKWRAGEAEQAPLPNRTGCPLQDVVWPTDRRNRHGKDVEHLERRGVVHDGEPSHRGDACGIIDELAGPAQRLLPHEVDDLRMRNPEQ